MTVTKVHNAVEFVGVSGDTKPTDAPAGSRFIERDTGLEFIWDGTDWGQLRYDPTPAE